MTSCRCRLQRGRDFPSTNWQTSDTSQQPEVSKSRCDTTRELMFELEDSYFDITSRFWSFCQMWYFGYHGFEAIIQLSTGKNGMRTFNMVRVNTN